MNDERLLDVPNEGVREVSCTRADVAAVVLACAATTLQVLTWVVPELRGLGDQGRQCFVVVALTALVGVVLRWGWRALRPRVVQGMWKFLGKPPGHHDTPRD